MSGWGEGERAPRQFVSLVESIRIGWWSCSGINWLQTSSTNGQIRRDESKVGVRFATAPLSWMKVAQQLGRDQPWQNFSQLPPKGEGFCLTTYCRHARSGSGC